MRSGSLARVAASGFILLASASASAAGAATLGALAEPSLTHTVLDFPSLLRDAIADNANAGVEFTIARDINNRGQVLGIGLNGTQSRVFVWSDGITTVLETLGGPFASANGISENGQVAGSSETSADGMHAFLWRDGAITDLGPLAAAAVNERGQVVGKGGDPGSPAHAALWQKGIFTDLGTLGGAVSEAIAINEHGQIVGKSRTVAGEEHSFLWQDGALTDLGTLGGPSSRPIGINSRGQVAGVSETASGPQHAFLWQKGALTDLGDLGGGATPFDFSERGQVTGVSGTTIGQIHGFLWENGAIADLGTLGGTLCHPYAINERGQVVGGSSTAAGETHAFLWERGVMIDLGTLGGRSSEAYAVNERGQVVGISQISTGEYRAFLWDRGIMTNLGTVLSSASRMKTDIASGLSSIDFSSVRSAPGAFHAALRVTSRPGAIPLEFKVFGLPRSQQAASIFDVQGRLIRRWEGSVADGAPGSWDGRRGDGTFASAGIYFLRVETAGHRLRAKILVAR